jgi:hypothetical protein
MVTDVHPDGNTEHELLATGLNSDDQHWQHHSMKNTEVMLRRSLHGP